MAGNAITTGVVTTIAVILVLGAVPPLAPAASHDAPTAVGPAVDSQPEYNVTFNSTTIGELVLRNVTITDVRAEEVVVDELTIGNETSEDVELENVTFDRLNITHATIRNVSTGELSVRDRSVLNVPGGELLGNVGDRSLKRHVLNNLTVSGVAIGRLHVENLTLRTELESIEGSVEGQPDEGQPEEPAVSVADAEVGTAVVANASFRRGAIENASVENETVTPGGDAGTPEDDDETTESSGEENAVSARTGR